MRSCGKSFRSDRCVALRAMVGELLFEIFHVFEDLGVVGRDAQLQGCQIAVIKL
jgi:hypothetical protein